MRSRVRRPRAEPAELCAAPGCTRECASGLPACAEHFGEIPAHEQVGYFEARDAALMAPDVQAARRAARNRVAALLRGVRA